MSIENPDDFTDNGNVSVSPDTVAPFLGVKAFAAEAEGYQAVVLHMEKINEDTDAALAELPRRDLNQRAQEQERSRLLAEEKEKLLAAYHGWEARGVVLAEQERHFTSVAVRVRAKLSEPTNRVIAARFIAEDLALDELEYAVEHAVGHRHVAFGHSLKAEVRRRELPREIKERLLRQLDGIPLPEAEDGQAVIRDHRGWQARADVALQGGVRAPSGAKLYAARKRGL